MSQVELLVSALKAVTLKAIESDLNNGLNAALYFATEKQIDTLIDSNRISADFSYQHQDAQEEMRIMMAEF